MKQLRVLVRDDVHDEDEDDEAEAEEDDRDCSVPLLQFQDLVHQFFCIASVAVQFRVTETRGAVVCGLTASASVVTLETRGSGE